MTEDEAKEKACCGPRNNGSSGDDDILCIGSSCMAWRTVRIGRVLEGDEYQTFTTEVFCGLAGVPA